MTEPFIGEIRMVGFNSPPNGWALCNGQQLAISQYSGLFSLLGTSFGGNGVSTFALPNLMGRVPMCSGLGMGLSPAVIGQTGGMEEVPLTTAQMPGHNHALFGSDQGLDTQDPTAAVSCQGGYYYKEQPPDVTMSAQAIGSAGGGQPHENRQPFLVVNFIIALTGVFPSRG
jgi:microcystin-dependent protein